MMQFINYSVRHFEKHSIEFILVGAQDPDTVYLLEPHSNQFIALHFFLAILSLSRSLAS